MNLSHAPWLAWPAVTRVSEVFGDQLRFVGGAVRDTLLGREVTEVDAATPLPPPEVMALLEKAGIKAVPTGLAHGTITAVLDGKSIEITTLRRDVATDGRHAEVAFTTDWEQDAKRRDFTINALYVDSAGKLYDYTGGQKDVETKRLRFIGEAGARIREDYLRILRYWRFCAQLGWQPDTDARAACRQLAGPIDGLSGERIAAEMLKTLGAASLDDELLAAMHEDGILAQVGLEQRVAIAPLLHLETRHRIAPDALRRLAYILLHSGGKDQLLRIRERWRLSGKHYDTLGLYLSRAVPDTIAEQKKLLRTVGREAFLQLALLHLRADYAALRTLADAWPIPVFPVTGADLLAQGMEEGKSLGEALKTLEETWESRDYQPSKEELLRLCTNLPSSSNT